MDELQQVLLTGTVRAIRNPVASFDSGSGPFDSRSLRSNRACSLESGCQFNSQQRVWEPIVVS